MLNDFDMKLLLVSGIKEVNIDYYVKYCLLFI